MTRKNIELFLRYWLPAGLWAYFIFFSSSVPGEDIPSLFPYQDIFYHLIAYLIFAWLLRRAFFHSLVEINILRQVYLVITITVVYAATDEFHQLFVSGRDLSLFDLLMDGIGSSVGAVIYRWRK